MAQMRASSPRSCLPRTMRSRRRFGTKPNSRAGKINELGAVPETIRACSTRVVSVDLLHRTLGCSRKCRCPTLHALSLDYLDTSIAQFACELFERMQIGNQPMNALDRAYA